MMTSVEGLLQRDGRGGKWRGREGERRESRKHESVLPRVEAPLRTSQKTFNLE